MYVPSTSKVIAHPDGCKQGNGRPCKAKNVPNWRKWAKNNKKLIAKSKDFTMNVKPFDLIYVLCKMLCFVRLVQRRINRRKLASVWIAALQQMSLVLELDFFQLGGEIAFFLFFVHGVLLISLRLFCSSKRRGPGACHSACGP